MTTIGSLLEWSTTNYPNKTAIIYEEKRQKWSYSELNEKVNCFAHSLTKLGVEKGDVVSTFLYNTSEFVVALFASAKLGAVFNPINYRLSASELQYILNDANSKVLLFEKTVSEVVHSAIRLGMNVQHYIDVDSQSSKNVHYFYELVENGENEKPAIQVTEEDMYILMYTSGTTGKPKGVLHRHRDMVHHSFLMIQCMGLTKNDIGLAIAPLNHTAELHTSFIPRLHVGATSIIMKNFDAEVVLETIGRERVSHIFAAPTMVNMMLNVKGFEKYDLSSLRLLGYGGASMAPVLIKRFQEATTAELVQMFGTTEMGPVMTVLFADEQLERAGSAGKAILSHEVKIVRVNEDGSPSHPDDECDVGEIGEIIVKGPCMMKEYYRLPEATENALAFGWYHTGDMASFDDDGYIWIRDRMDYMINTGAENVYPREVEDSILEHPSVFDVAVVGKPDAKWGAIIVAFVAPKEGMNITAEELDAFLKNGEKLASFKRPREYNFVDELPKTASGKIQKYLLKQ
ncbi:long-chain-fatty-acid--CoA ligase [Sporosarcina sp. CAU 1771]